MPVKITGMNEVMAKLKKIDRQFDRKVVVPAINAGLTPIMNQAKRNCKWQSIRELISKKAFIAKKDKSPRGKVFLKQDKERKIRLEGRDVGFEVVGNILEFGSQKINIRPRPYMRPARDQAKAAAKAAIEKKAKERFKKL